MFPINYSIVISVLASLISSVSWKGHAATYGYETRDRPAGDRRIHSKRREPFTTLLGGGAIQPDRGKPFRKAIHKPDRREPFEGRQAQWFHYPHQMHTEGRQSHPYRLDGNANKVLRLPYLVEPVRPALLVCSFLNPSFIYGRPLKERVLRLLSFLLARSFIDCRELVEYFVKARTFYRNNIARPLRGLTLRRNRFTLPPCIPSQDYIYLI